MLKLLDAFGLGEALGSGEGVEELGAGAVHRVSVNLLRRRHNHRHQRILFIFFNSYLLRTYGDDRLV